MGKYFTVEELCKSNTAKAKGISNVPNHIQTDNLEQLIKNVLDPLREAYGKPIYVNSGFRCETLNKAVGGTRNSEHCFDENTELLTINGWKKYNELNIGDAIFTYSIDRDKIEVSNIDELIIYHHKGEMVHILNKGIDLLVTSGHRMVVRYESHKYKKKGNRNISPTGQAYFDSLKTNNDKYHIEIAKDIFKKRRFFLSASKTDGSINDLGNINLLKISMAVIADGFIHTKNKRFSGIGFALKKERKINRIIELLNELNITYKTSIRKSDGAFIIWINSTNGKAIYSLIGRNKKIPKIAMMLPSLQIKELVYEYAFYDGSFDKREGCNSFSITTTDTHNKDVLQTMCILSNMRCILRVKEAGEYNIKGKAGKTKKSYILSIVYSKNEIIVQEKDYSIEKYDGIVWCANNKNTTVIVRRNNKVSIQGNCTGRAADIDVHSKEGNKQLFDLIQKLNLPFRQLIDESNFSWVHVSYNKNDVKKQVLKL